jgi:hypothetical protein
MDLKYNSDEVDKLKQRISNNKQFFEVKTGEGQQIVARTTDVARLEDLADYMNSTNEFRVLIFKSAEAKTPINFVNLVIKGISDGLGNIHSEQSITEKIKIEVRKELELEELKKENAKKEAIIAKKEEEIKDLLIEIGEKDEVINNGNMTNLFAKGAAEFGSLLIQKNPQLVGALGGFLGAGQPAQAGLTEEEQFFMDLGKKVFETFVNDQNFDFFQNNILPFIKQDNLLLNDIFQMIQNKYGEQQN